MAPKTEGLPAPGEGGLQLREPRASAPPSWPARRGVPAWPTQPRLTCATAAKAPCHPEPAPRPSLGAAPRSPDSPGLGVGAAIGKGHRAAAAAAAASRNRRGDGARLPSSPFLPRASNLAPPPNLPEVGGLHLLISRPAPSARIPATHSRGGREGSVGALPTPAKRRPQGWDRRSGPLAGNGRGEDLTPRPSFAGEA